MYLLDTNIISETMKKHPDTTVISWLDTHHCLDKLYTSSITQAELLSGVYKMPDGKRKLAYRQAVQDMFMIDFFGKVLSFDTLSAFYYAKLITHRFKIGKPISMADAQIASIALAHDFILVTRNTKDFIAIDDLKLFNPFEPIL